MKSCGGFSALGHPCSHTNAYHRKSLTWSVADWDAYQRTSTREEGRGALRHRFLRGISRALAKR